MDIIQIIFIGIVIIIMIKGIKLDIKSQSKSVKKKKRKKYHNPSNNYFRNNPEHVDLTHEYIESIWEEIK